jgi:hypothetical protein
MLLRYAFLCIFFLTPFYVFADLEIVEIMYDQEGTDTNREWIEIYNSGADFDLAHWYFFENDVHHDLVFDGSSIIKNNERMLIAQDRETIASLVGNNVRIIKSSFSLNNSGETISLSDDQKLPASTVSYTSDQGALGDGNSLQLYNGAWISAQPTPGVINKQSAQDQKTPSDKAVPHKSKDTDKPIIKENYYSGYIHVEHQSVAKSPVVIEAFVHHIYNGKTTKKIKGGVYFLNFGDGSFVESTSRIITEHIYDQPGTYQVAFEFYPSRLSEKHEDPKVIIFKDLVIYENNLEITHIDTSSLISIKNNSSIDVDLEGWNLAGSHAEFIFPKHSRVLAGGITHIPFRVHGLVRPNVGESFLLRNQNNNTIYSYKHTNKISTPTASLVVKSLPENETLAVVEPLDIGEELSSIDVFLQEHPEKEYAHFIDTKIIPSEETDKVFVGTIVIIGSVVLVFGCLKFLYIRSKKELINETISYGEIELIE